MHATHKTRIALAAVLGALSLGASAQSPQNKMGVTEPEVNYQAGASPLANEPMYLAFLIGRVVGSDNVDTEVVDAFDMDTVIMSYRGRGRWYVVFPELEVAE